MSAKKIDPSAPVEIEDFRRYLGQAMNHVQYGGRSIRVRRYGQEAAVLISVDEYDELCRLRASRPERQNEDARKAATAS